jgi:hypothetical protein
VNPNIDIKYRDEARALDTVRNEQSPTETFAPVDWDFYTFDSPNKRKISFQLDVEFANIITAATSAEDMELRLNTWIEEQMPIVQPVLDELNAAFGA